jgi:hypothetical protein
VTDFADHCDACGEGIKYGAGSSGTNAYLLPTGETWDNLPVVRVLCPPCYEKGAA